MQISVELLIVADSIYVKKCMSLKRLRVFFVKEVICMVVCSQVFSVQIINNSKVQEKVEDIQMFEDRGQDPDGQRKETFSQLLVCIKNNSKKTGQRKFKIDSLIKITSSLCHICFQSMFKYMWEEVKLFQRAARLHNISESSIKCIMSIFSIYHISYQQRLHET